MKCIVRVAVLVTAAIVATAVPDVSAQDRTRGARCNPNTFHRYGIVTSNTSSRARWPDYQATLYYQANRSAFLMILFDDDSDVVVSSAGVQRFVQQRAGLLPGERYELWIGCIQASSTFRLLVTMGEADLIFNRGTVRGAQFGADYDVAEQAVALDREAVANRLMAEFAASVPTP